MAIQPYAPLARRFTAGRARGRSRCRSRPGRAQSRRSLRRRLPCRDGAPVRILGIALLVFLPMIVEAMRAGRNERAQLGRGGVLAPGDVHDTMRLVYPGVFLWMILEGAFRPFTPSVF